MNDQDHLPLVTAIILGLFSLLVVFLMAWGAWAIVERGMSTPQTTLGNVLVFPDGWTPVTQGQYRDFTCEKDGVYRECTPVEVHPPVEVK